MIIAMVVAVDVTRRTGEDVLGVESSIFWGLGSWILIVLVVRVQSSVAEGMRNLRVF